MYLSNDIKNTCYLIATAIFQPQTQLSELVAHQVL